MRIRSGDEGRCLAEKRKSCSAFIASACCRDGRLSDQDRVEACLKSYHPSPHTSHGLSLEHTEAR